MKWQVAKENPNVKNHRQKNNLDIQYIIIIF
jgi:hypothetical protein